MSNPTLPNPAERDHARLSTRPALPMQNRRPHLEQARGPKRGSAISILAGYGAYLLWEYMIIRRNDKRSDEIHEEFQRRAQLIQEGNKEILRLISEGEANK